MYLIRWSGSEFERIRNKGGRESGGAIGKKIETKVSLFEPTGPVTQNHMLEISLLQHPQPRP